ncbi:IS66 family insertion sequence element accessory protein TnpB [Photorhabdus luminescens]|uniref:IS66 family insertion sequence element accessory protein TnpB n=1 Tax=Photorhabdus luminescens TaxID=29488 RepID=UPI003BB7AE93
MADITDLRNGFNGLAPLVQNTLRDNSFSGQAFIFRGHRGDMIKVLWVDADGLYLFTKRQTSGRWSLRLAGAKNEKIHLTPAQLAMLLEGINWKHREHKNVWGIPLINEYDCSFYHHGEREIKPVYNRVGGRL